MSAARRNEQPSPEASFWPLVHAHARLTEGERLSRIREGLSWRWAELVKMEFRLGPSAIERFINISTSTFERKKRADLPLDQVASERLDRLASVVLLAEEVFESSEAASEWMTTPNQALGGLSPVESCDTEIGAKQVRRILHAIEWGGVA
ncbi:putative toxin-antitoxin system antitoxin component [compost metagenome]|uniref:Putative toxin-antitoxin system antitoxin component, TIGR02293 family n=1 Tax=Pseudomonas jinjuensis TaxID=198616 RepID=A0A1H0D1P9_9PSED|nr:antitoxin Xre/MbcA/ParS toxin-binding domain-containing protein [Pseudomonas jinjuensis]SDN63966.1 putative toxin-antitoxin system antitoxin component, TIGR02293 family [Pseudomonas jinjuensis]